MPEETKPFVVVGAGIVGVCCALYLQREGRRVVVVDPLPPGASCSSGNAGLMATGGVAPEAMPGIARQVPGMLADPEGPLAIDWTYLPRLAPWLVRYVLSSRPARVEQISLALASLSQHVLPAYEPLVQSAGAADMIHRHGWLHLYESEAAFAGAAPARDLRRRRGVAVHELPAEEIRQLEPDLAPIFARAAFFPDFGHTVNPRRFAETLAADFVRGGGRFLSEEVVDFETGPAGVEAVRTRGGRHSAAGVVLAAGAWSKKLAKRLGSAVPLDTERGYHVMLGTPGVTLRRPLASGEGGFAITPMEHGLRIAGTVELAGLKAPPNPARNEAMLRRTRRMLPGLDTTERTDWMGFRPSLPDSLPVIGPAGSCRNAWLAFGHGHRGLSFAAITGKLIAEMVAGRPPSLDAAPFRADRFRGVW